MSASAAAVSAPSASSVSAATPAPRTVAPDAPRLPTHVAAFAWHFVKKFRWGFGAMALFEVGQSLSEIYTPYVIKQMMDTVAAHAGTPDVLLDLQSSPLLTSLLVFVGINLAFLMCSRASGTLIIFTLPPMRVTIREALFSYLQFHSHRYFLGNFAGSIAHKVTEVATAVRDIIAMVTFDFWPVLIAFSSALYLVANTNGRLALVLGTWIALYITVSFLLARKCREYSQAYSEARSTVTGKIVDAVTNIANVKLFARRMFEQRYLHSYHEAELIQARKTIWFFEKMRWFQGGSAILLKVVMILMALQVWVEGEITVGEFTMVAALSMLIINYARNLSMRFLELFESVGTAADGLALILRSHDVIDRPGASPLVVNKGEIRFENVVFTHDGTTPVFNGLNLTIPAGQKVGLVGTSGAGKSTFANLLLRLFDLQSGRILIDGQNIAEVTQDSLRASVSVIPQDPMLFHRSLMENIRYGRETATDADVIEAARSAYCHEFIEQMPQKYQALVGERGVKLSGGQRQRIAIARAIVKNAPILLLDEATSSLDSGSERYIQDSLERLMKGRTVIVIAHRLSTIARMDRILVFERGQIVEDGSHDDLLKRQGTYSRLWHMQAGGFLPE